MADQYSIAITGLSCRFPGECNDIDGFWRSICAASWSKIPQDRFNIDGFWSSTKRRNTSVTYGAHFLKEDVSHFDANFFSIPHGDVDAIDPQQRIMLEVAYEALENAGIPLSEIAGSQTGVFMGHFTSDYKEMVYRDPDSAPAHSITGLCKTSLANRISWLWDLKGPSLTLDTACSSSLVAVHLACQSLRSGDSDIAIVGGSNLILSPEFFVFLSNQGFISPDGKSKSFDESANGYGRGEGFGCVVLKRVDSAIQANDNIRAVIRGSGSNQDGRTTGFTLPSADAQAALMRETYKNAGLDMKDTDYVEAHGTGTQAGDVREMEALSRTIAKSRTPGSKLIVGSVKANIGHLEAAAGVAGLIKAVLVLERRMIPPNIHFKRGNPQIKFDDWNVQVPTQQIPWETSKTRRISVNSFGYGGTNAHVILEASDSYLKERGHNDKGPLETLSPCESNPHALKLVNGGHTNDGSRGTQLLVISAQDKDGLERVKAGLADYVRMKAAATANETPGVSDLMPLLAQVLSERRSRLQWKTFVIATTPDSAVRALNDETYSAPILQSSREPRIGFVFTGQGAQWPQMGIELMDYEIFKVSVAAADRYLQTVCKCPWSAVEELHRGKSTSQLHLAEFSQTLCTVLQVALVDLLRSWNVFPKAVVGHSSGEIAAAYCMGALSSEDAWKIAYYRGKLSSEMTISHPNMHGSMMAAGLSAVQAEHWITKVDVGSIVVACINSPSSVTISGDADGIDQLTGMLEQEGIFARKLKVNTAYHSAHMQTIAQDYYEAIADVRPIQVRGDCTMHSSVTGTSIDASELGAINWVRNLTSPVLFADAVQDLVRPVKNGLRTDGNVVDFLVEIGPHSALRGPSIQSLDAKAVKNFPYYSIITRNGNAMETALNLAGTLFAHGVPINIPRVNSSRESSSQKLLMDLPSYPWKHTQRYWHRSRIEKDYLMKGRPKTSLIGRSVPIHRAGEHLWRGFIGTAEHSWILDHKMQGATIYPGAGYLIMALEAASQIATVQKTVAAYRLRNVQFTTAALMGEAGETEFIVHLRPNHQGAQDSHSSWMEFAVTSSPDGVTLMNNCSGHISVEYVNDQERPAQSERQFELRILREQFSQAKEDCRTLINAESFYHDLRELGLDYGPAFTNLSLISNASGQSVCTLTLPDVSPNSIASTQSPLLIHPATLDTIFHLAFAAVKGGKEDLTTTMVPTSLGEIMISAHMPSNAGLQLPGFSNCSKHGSRELNSRIIIFDTQAKLPVVEVTDLVLTEIVGGKPSSVGSGNLDALTSKLVWKPAVGLLSLAEQKALFQRKSCVEAFSECLNLLYHTDPTLSVLEITPDDHSPAKISVVGRLKSIDRILETGTVTIAHQNSSIELEDEEAVKLHSRISIKRLEIPEASEPANDELHDLIFMTLPDSEVREPSIKATDVARLLKPDGRLCILGASNLLKSLRSSLFDVGLQILILSDATGFDPANSDLLVASKTGIALLNATEAEFEPEPITLMHLPDAGEVVQGLVTKLTQALADTGHTVEMFTWGADVSKLEEKSCISLIELEHPFFDDLKENDFVSFQQLTAQMTKILWVVGSQDPSSTMVDGLARVVRNETPGLEFCTLHVENRDHLSADSIGDLIARVFHHDTVDNEFLVRDGVLHISRIEADEAQGKEVGKFLPGSEAITSMELSQTQYPTKLCVRTPGMLDTLCLEPDRSFQDDLEDDFIEIQVMATTINSREIMVAMGQLSESKLGLDAAGIVTRIGAAVQKFKLGDRVAMYGHGSHRTLHRSRADYCAVIPDDMTFEQAASISTAHGTAWNALVRLAKVQKGQTILIHAAAGGIGQAAIQIAKHFELEIFATVSSQAKRTLIKEAYAIPDDHIFNSRDLDFVKGIKRMTCNRGVDVILNSLSGEMLQQTWRCIAPFGHFIEIGLKDFANNNSGLEMKPFLQNATFSYFNLTHIEEGKPQLMAEIIENTFDLQRRGITRPAQPLTIYSLSEIEAAFHHVQSGEHMGKIVITWDQNAIVPVVERKSGMQTLQPDKVYVLAGGLGGLGRSLALKLVDLGARKLCFLSRSGADSPHAKALTQLLQQHQPSVQVKVYKCDITDANALSRIVKQCSTDLGEIKGLFQCAMVLQDTLFYKMTHTQWINSTRPKVQGTWNLHTQLLHCNLDFFIVLSSFAGIFGNRGQSNYAAAGAFQDALALHRRAQGLKSVTIDLGIMRDIGVIAEKGISESLREWEEPYGITEPTFHALIEHVLHAEIHGAPLPLPAQIITGLATGGSAIEANIPQPFYLSDPRFSHLARKGLRHSTSLSAAAAASSSSSRPNPSNLPPPHLLISQSTTLSEATARVLNALLDLIAKMVQTDKHEIDTHRFLHSFGVDSLGAIGVVDWALKEVKSKITIFDVMAPLSLEVLAAQMVKKSSALPEGLGGK